MDASGSVAHKSWWGPRIWRVLHALAEIGEGRIDTVGGWRAVLRTTTSILPCAVCREHFGTAVQGWRIPSGVRHGLWAAHAAVSQSETGLPEAELSGLYGGVGCDGVMAIVAEVGREFRCANVLDRFRIGYLVEWERAVGAFVRLLRLPPAVPPTSPQAGRPRGPSGGSPAGSPASRRGRPILRPRRVA